LDRKVGVRRTETLAWLRPGGGFGVGGPDRPAGAVRVACRRVRGRWKPPFGGGFVGFWQAGAERWWVVVWVWCQVGGGPLVGASSVWMPAGRWIRMPGRRGLPGRVGGVFGVTVACFAMRRRFAAAYVLAGFVLEVAEEPFDAGASAAGRCLLPGAVEAGLVEGKVLGVDAGVAAGAHAAGCCERWGGQHR